MRARKLIAFALALIAAIAFGGCADKPHESVIEDLLGQIYAENLRERAADFKIKAQITDRMEEEKGGYIVFFDYTITAKTDVNTNGIWRSLNVGGYALPLIANGTQISCAKAQMQLKRTEKRWLLANSKLPAVCVSPQVQAQQEAARADAERKQAMEKAEAERKQAEEEAAWEAEYVKPLVEVQSLPTITNSVGMEFVLIPAGTFQMGCYEDPAAAKAIALGQIKSPC
ncbi:hypothetical protein AGMMS50229_21500 [Campylobacterota bacterium]|nr:hypothetical protein AGMMS50229_21500 [Campylobacterota bacterium]